VTGERVYSVYKLVLKHTQTQTHRPATGHDSRGGESVLQLRGKPGKHALTHTRTHTHEHEQKHTWYLAKLQGHTQIQPSLKGRLDKVTILI